jgi:hypothetical protein
MLRSMLIIAFVILTGSAAFSQSSVKPHGFQVPSQQTRPRVVPKTNTSDRSTTVYNNLPTLAAINIANFLPYKMANKVRRYQYRLQQYARMAQNPRRRY